MTTVVNTPGTNADNSGSGMGMVIGVVVLLVVLFLLFFYGLPLIRRGAAPATNAPNVNSTDNSINLPDKVNVPDEVDVNVQQPQGQ